MIGEFIDVEYRGGVYLPELDLWLDPHGPRERAFVSHAHADHFGRHGRVFCGEVTGKLAHLRFGLPKKVIEGRALCDAFEMDGFRLEYLPAGHIVGSAMLHVTRLSDGATLLYTGDFKMRVGRSCEEVILKEADTLIMETTFGLPKYVFPPEEEVEREIVGFVQGAIDEGEVPVLLGYSLGKAQEIHAILDAHGIACVLHKTVARMTEACASAGLVQPPFEVFEGVADLVGKALVAPPNSVRSKMIRGLKNGRVAMMSGWAMNESAKYRYMTDAAFPLSDHADYPGLLECVRVVKPKRVLTLHGSAREFATDLRKLGYDAWSVFGNDQVELDFDLVGDVVAGEGVERVGCGFAEFTDVCVAVGRVPGRLRKREILAEYLRGLGEGELRVVGRFLIGRPLGRVAEQRALQVGVAMVRRAVVQAAGVPERKYKEVSASQADSARTVRILLEGARVVPEGFGVLEVGEFFGRIAEMDGALNKTIALGEFFGRLHPRESETLVRLLTGDLRIGLKDGLLEEAIAEAFGAEVLAVRRAHMLVGDLGEVAVLALDEELDGARLVPHVAVKAMLASPEETAEGIWGRLGGDGAVWVEDKYDGIRAQLHVAGGEVSLYSRDLRDLGGEFGELVDAARSLPDCVLDGELIAYAEGRRLGFFDLQKRLGRKTGQGDLFLGDAVPVKFVAFDCLWADGEALLDVALERRREVMEGLGLERSFEVIGVSRVGSVEAMEEVFKAAKVAGNEGLIAKDPGSVYSPGRRGKSWLKLKKAMPTLDCVVVKAQQGHGRRAEVLSDYTFAVRDDEGELRVIGKAYSGLTDVEIEELTEFFRETTISKARRVHTVEPRVVLEIAFDSVNPSKRHDSGLAMRFPRIKAIRRDKGIGDVDTLGYARTLVGK